jgi:signal transduction histidine kinase/DNA-binding response OmpR family regulator/HPt (histidine-containing phosphotransfer) domain-containing protein
MAESVELTDPDAPVLSSVERKRVLSATRLKLTLTIFVVAILFGLSAMIFVGVTRIFDWLTPSIRADLRHKAQRGALELSETAQLGLVVREPADIARPARDYVQDPDVMGIDALDAEGRSLFSHGHAKEQLAELLKQKPNQAQDLGTAYGAWSPSVIEGIEVGRIALIVTKARLEAGIELRRQVLILGGFGCFLALGLCLLFVNMYIGPILQMTEQTFVRLEHTTEAALTAARLKSQFLANMSHEIRTPMNGILGVLDLINRTDLSSKQQRYVQIIESSARSLLTIINDVLDFSKMEAGKYELRADEFEVRQITQEVAELLSPKAHDKTLDLIMRVDPAVPQTIIGDMDRIKQVLNNLIGNAIKFTEHGHVELRVSVESAAAEELTLRFAVTDTGLGISQADQARLFAVFSQVDGSLTRKHGGTGLGLAISKQLAAAMGGKIGVESEPGQGSTFWFTIITRAGLRAPAPPAQREARVLIVCPSYAQREVVRELIERWGMTCTLTDSVPSAVEVLLERQGGFDVVVMDGAVEQGESDASALLEMCLGEALPVIHMLSTAQIAHGTASGEAQRNYLLKPLRASELYNGLVNVLEGGTVQQRPRVTANVPKRSSVSPQRPTILVVDDNEINRVVAVDLLNEIGYPSDTACTGAEAVIKAKHGVYGAILMDCQMPEMDGYEATRQIRALPAPIKNVPIIALTAHALTGDRDRVLNAGMDDYTTKPIRVRTLEQLLRKWEGVSAERHKSMPAPANENAAAEPVSDAEIVARLLARPQLDELPELDPTLPRSKPVVELFLKSVPGLLESLASVMAEGDTVNVKLLAHKLKGNCLSLGAAKMAAACAAIENAAAAAQLHHEAHQLLPELFSATARRLDPARGSQAAGARASGSHHG